MSCSIANKQTFRDKNMTTKNRRISPPKVDYDNLDTILTCDIYQYEGADSNDIRISKIIKYGINNNLLSEEFKDFKTSLRDGTANVITYYDYKDRLLVQKRTLYIDNTTPTFNSQDSAKIIFSYNDQGLLEKREHYDLKKRLKPNVDKGFGRPGGCIIDENDYEERSSWDITGVIFFKYDSLGRQIEYYAPSIFWTNQNRYTWSYNTDNKITDYCSYEDQRMIWDKKFAYTDSSFQYTRTWYDYDGTPEHLKEKSWEYTPQITHVFKLDSRGRVIEEIVKNEKGKFQYRSITEYNTSGFVSKEIRYDEKDKPEITHIYKYDKIKNSW